MSPAVRFAEVLVLHEDGHDDWHETETIRRGLQVPPEGGVGLPCVPTTRAAARARLLASPPNAGEPAAGKGAAALIADFTNPAPALTAFLHELRAARPDVALVLLVGLRPPPGLGALTAAGAVVLRRPFRPDDLRAALERA